MRELFIGWDFLFIGAKTYDLEGECSKLDNGTHKCKLENLIVCCQKDHKDEYFTICYAYASANQVLAKQGSDR